MLFERIRRTQKPVFIFLAVMFGLGFVALGVGSGAGGVNLGDILNSGGSSGTSISDLSNTVHDHPNDAVAWRQLAEAYQADGQLDPAIGAYLRYVGLRPKDQNGLSGTATLLEERATKEQQRLSVVEAQAAQYTAPATASASSALKLSPALTHSLENSLSQPYTTKAQTLQSQVQSDLTQATSLRQKLVNLDPKNASYQLQLVRDSASARQYSTAVTALKAYLKLSPNLPASQEKQYRRALTELEALAATSSSGPTTTP